MDPPYTGPVTRTSAVPPRPARTRTSTAQRCYGAAIPCRCRAGKSALTPNLPFFACTRKNSKAGVQHRSAAPSRLLNRESIASRTYEAVGMLITFRTYRESHCNMGGSQPKRSFRAFGKTKSLSNPLATRAQHEPHAAPGEHRT